MNLDTILHPVRPERFDPPGGFAPGQWGALVDMHFREGLFPADLQHKLCLIGITEEGSRRNPADSIRRYLYQLRGDDYAGRFCDLGDYTFDPGKGNDYRTLSVVLSEVRKQGGLPLLLGRSARYTYAQYLAHEYREEYVNLVQVAPQLSLDLTKSTPPEDFDYLASILLREPNYLFNFSQIGYQSYFMDPRHLELLEQLYFEGLRLGDIRADLKLAEPIMRQCNLLSIDMSATRYADYQAGQFHSPNGFAGEEICALGRYAGLNGTLYSAGIYNYYPERDESGQNAHLIAHAVWYLVEGLTFNHHEHPHENREQFTRYIARFDKGEDHIIFYKSPMSGRWWVEVPIDPQHADYQQHQLVPCTYEDYLQAVHHEIPDRYWKAMMKLA